MIRIRQLFAGQDQRIDALVARGSGAIAESSRRPVLVKRVERWTLVASVFVLFWALVGLVTVHLGLLRWWLVIPVAALATVLTAKGRLQTRGQGREADRSFPLLVVGVFAIGITLFGLMNPGEHVFTGRDAATYLATGGWIAHAGSLRVEARVGPFAESEDLVFSAPGFYDRRDDGRLTPQFLHAFPAMLATLGQLGGVSTMLVLNPLLGGLGLVCCYFVAVRLSSAVAALTAVVVLGSSQIFTYFTRGPYSEPLALVFFLSGVLAILSLHKDRYEFAVLGGGLLGGVALARLDGLILLIGVAAVLVVARRTKPSWLGDIRRIAIGYVSVVAVAVVDLAIDPFYARGRNVQIGAVAFAAVAILIFGYVLPDKAAQGVLSNVRRHRRQYAVAVLATLGALVAILWFIRPEVLPASGDTYALESLQETAGVPVDGSRTYAELSVQWLTWYIGAFTVAVGFVGLGIFGWREMVRPSIEGWIILALITPVVAIYLWRPSINPDHIWAMRRFLPVVLPALALAVSVCIHSLASWTKPVGRWLAVPLAIACVCVVLTRLPQTAAFHALEGAVSDLENLCEALDGNAVLVVDPDPEGLVPRLGQSLRSYCHVPAAGLASYDDLNMRTQELADAWNHEGSGLFILSPSTDALNEVPVGSLQPFLGQYRVLESTLFSPPASAAFVDYTIYGGVVSPSS